MFLVYLFGSRAEGRAGAGSDYDLGILLDRGQDSPGRRARLSHDLTVILETAAVDVVYVNQAPPELAFAVIQGRLLYERDLATRVEFEAYVMGRYYDYLPYCGRSAGKFCPERATGTEFSGIERRLDELSARFGIRAAQDRKSKARV